MSENKNQTVEQNKIAEQNKTVEKNEKVEEKKKVKSHKKIDDPNVIKRIDAKMLFDDRYFVRNMFNTADLVCYLRKNTNFQMEFDKAAWKDFRENVVKESAGSDIYSEYSLVDYVNKNCKILRERKVYCSSRQLTATMFVYMKNVMDQIEVKHTDFNAMPLQRYQHLMKYLSDIQPIGGKKWYPSHPFLIRILKDWICAPGHLPEEACGAMLGELMPNPMPWWNDITWRTATNLLKEINERGLDYLWPEDQKPPTL